MAGSLHAAARRGNLKDVRILIEEFSDDINGYDFQKMTPLHHASKRGHTEVVQYLLEHGANFELRNGIGQTPLHVAAQAGACNAARVLLEHNADPNTVSDHDVRPIHRVSKKGFHEMANILLKAGADLHVADSFLGECAIHHAAIEGHIEIIRLLMCNAKRCLDDSNVRGETALHMAVENNHLECCRVLLTMSVTNKWKIEFLNKRDLRQEETALHRACLRGHSEVSRLLLDSKAVPDIRNILGRTALHLAAAGEDPTIVIYLLRAGADHMILDCDGKRPVQYCKQDKMRMAFGSAIGIPTGMQLHMTAQRQGIVDVRRSQMRIEEQQRAMGAKDVQTMLLNHRKTVEARNARAVQHRIDVDQLELCERLRRNRAHKIIVGAWTAYRAAKEEKRRELERAKRREAAEASRNLRFGAPRKGVA